MKIEELRGRRNELARELLNLTDQNRGNWNKETHGAEFDKLEGQITALDDQIAREERAINLAAESAVVKKTGDDKDAPTVKKLFDKWARYGEKSFNDADWAAYRNTLSTSTSSEGGYTVQTEVAATLIEAIKAYGGIRQVADQFATQMGNDMNFPTSDGTSETGEIIGQNTTATAADPVFGTVGLPVYKFSSKVVAVPFELLQDSSIDIEAFIAARLRTRLGRINNTKFTVGSGTNEPRGLITALTTGKTGTTGQTTSVIYDDLVDLQESIDDGYAQAGTMRWQMHQSSRKNIRKIKDTSGRPIWLPSYDTGMRGGVPEELLGAPIVINNDMAVMAANAKSIAYGDFSYYKVRDVMQVTLFRFNDSAYTKLGQVGFLAWQRAGGNWTDVGGAAKLYVNSAT